MALPPSATALHHGRLRAGLLPLDGHRSIAPREARACYAAALSRSPVEVGDELMAALRAEFSERELVENYVVAWENLRARSNKGLGIGRTGFRHESRRAKPESAIAGV